MKILVTHAIERERVEIRSDGHQVVYVRTGIGKVPAALKSFHALAGHRPDIVVNIGTAGSLVHEVGEIVVCGRFVDRDMEKIKYFNSPWEDDFTADLAACPLTAGWDAGGVCNAGDTFLTDPDGTGDVFDMESFGVASACRHFGVPMVAVKYVTDKIGENSIKAWEEKLDDARRALQRFVDARF